MRWSRISRPRLSSRLERVWCRANDLASGRRHPQNGQATLIRPLRTETKHAIDTGKARRIGQHLLAEALRSLRLHKRSDQRDSIIGQGRRTHRILSIAGAISSGETTEAG